MWRKVLFLLFVVINLQSQAFAFNPTISLIGSYTIVRNFVDISSGGFSIMNRDINFGLEGSYRFKFGYNYFLRTGIRYNQYKTTIDAVNEVPELFDTPAPIYWWQKYESLTLPVAVGRDFSTTHGKKGDYYMGCSFGVLMTSESGSGWNYRGPKDPANSDLIILAPDDPGLLPTYSFFTFDIGGSYHPFSSPRLGIGLMLSLQLNRTQPYTYTGTIENYSQGKIYSYRVQHQQQFANCSFILSYNFGKESKSRVKRNYGLDCPR